MLERVHATGALRGWFTADEAFGQNPVRFQKSAEPGTCHDGRSPP